MLCQACHAKREHDRSAECGFVVFCLLSCCMCVTMHMHKLASSWPWSSCMLCQACHAKREHDRPAECGFVMFCLLSCCMCVTMHMASFQLAMEPCMCMLGQACHAKRDDDPDLRVCRGCCVVIIGSVCCAILFSCMLCMSCKWSWRQEVFKECCCCVIYFCYSCWPEGQLSHMCK